MFTQKVTVSAAETIGTVTQVYDGTLTSDIQVNTFRHFDRLFPVRVVKHGPDVLALPSAARRLTRVQFGSGGKTYDLIDYMRLNRVTALLVLKDGKIAYEDYEMGNTAQTRWVSMSIAKSITSSLIGAVVRSAVGRPLAEYLSERIWTKAGMESDATWWLESPDGMEIGGSGLNATLRDYGRFGASTVSIFM